MNDRFDIAVIGGGSAGLVASGLLAALGARVVLVEKERLGGECLYTGCVPSKALIAAAEAWHARRRAPRHGLPEAPPQDVDLGAVMASVEQAISAVSSGPEMLRREGVAEVVFGPPRFVDPETLDVDGRRLHARRFVLCTGARPAVPDLPGLADVPHLTSRSIFGLRELPRRLAVVGTGPVGCELAQAFARLGSEVTLVGRAPRLLPRDDADLTGLLLEQLREEGLTVSTGTDATAVARAPDGGIVVQTRREGGPAEIHGDAVLLAVGRRPNVEGLELERIGVEVGEHGVTVDRHLRTTARHVWALGDVTGLTPFSHMAEAQARAVAPHIAYGVPVSFDRDEQVWATFTAPELARVGPDEETARRRHRRIEVIRLELGEADRAQAEHRTRGLAKIIVAGRRGKVVAAHLLAPHAGEMIQEWILARRHGLRLDQLSNAIHVYPSWSMLNQRAADQRFRAWGQTTRWRRWARRLHRWTAPLR